MEEEYIYQNRLNIYILKIIVILNQILHIIMEVEFL